MSRYLRHRADDAIAAEMELFLAKLAQKTTNHRLPVDLATISAAHFGNNSIKMIFGKRWFDYEEAPEVVASRTTLFNSAAEVVLALLFSPILDFLYKFAEWPLRAAVRRSRAILQSVARELRDFESRSGSGSDSESESDFYLKYALDDYKALPVQIRDRFVIGNIRALLEGSIETMTATGNWMALLMARYPAIQERVHAELDAVCGRARGRAIRWPMRDQLPYTCAVIAEVQRFAAILYFNLNRNAMTQMSLAGSALPRGTTVIFNYWSVNRDRKLFPDPHHFRPERFVNERGQFANDRNTIVYSKGKRICAAYQFANKQLFTYFATLLHNYRLAAPPGVQLSLDRKLYMLSMPKHVPELLLIRRSEN